MRRPFIKICGITQTQDIFVAAELGVDFIGVIFEIEESPRSVSIETASQIIHAAPIPVVLLLEKTQDEVKKVVSALRPYAVQLVGEVSLEMIRSIKQDTKCKIWKTFHIPQSNGERFSFHEAYNMLEQYRFSGVDVVVLDTIVMGSNKKKGGGTGVVCDWNIARHLVEKTKIPIFLAGGLTAENVKEAISIVKPYGVDLSSGVEADPGKKDPEKIASLLHVIDNM